MAAALPEARAGDRKRVVFLFNLLQDLNIVRGLVYLTARETDADILLLVSHGFLKRDRLNGWQSEVAVLAADTNASIFLYGSPIEATAALKGGTGIIFAGSESSLLAHWETSDVFRAAPPGYVRVTLQHGIECIGFLQCREHVMSHGRNVSFGADIVCGWMELPALTSMVASERAKLVVTGPPTLLQSPGSFPAETQTTGLVCENLHSVRLRASGDHKAAFMDIFFAFAAALAARGEGVTLRPHPGGQYVLKNNVALPANVELNNRPIFDVNLKAYRFGISAPSTIVLDMVLAGIPVGVWRDPAGVMDASTYDGLTAISTLDDWLAFERDIVLRPDMILERQRLFLERLRMPIKPAEIYNRFARLIVGLLSGVNVRASAAPADGPKPRPAALSGEKLVQVPA
ncbi:MAG: hypothetical protein M3428_05730 [Pseudomonadota bacterium]|nr:hypothetical protein [Pseudomonadota bacterium]